MNQGIETLRSMFGIQSFQRPKDAVRLKHSFGHCPRRLRSIKVTPLLEECLTRFVW
jgi:hypothetical protein